MPYQSSRSFFASLGLRRRSSPQEISAKIPRILAWIARHGDKRWIALLQVLVNFPSLYKDLRDVSPDLNEDEDLFTAVRQIGHDCLEIGGNKVEALHTTSLDLKELFAEVDSRISLFNSQVANAGIPNDTRRLMTKKVNKIRSRLAKMQIDMESINDRAAGLLNSEITHLVAPLNHHLRQAIEDKVAPGVQQNWP